MLPTESGLRRMLRSHACYFRLTKCTFCCAGDILSLVEKAESNIKADDAANLTKRLLAAKFDFNDFLGQYKMLNNMGPMGSVMKMLPGAATRPAP